MKKIEETCRPSLGDEKVEGEPRSMDKKVSTLYHEVLGR